MDIICPICQKGKLREGETSFMCDYFKSLDDKCSFIIWKKQYGVELDAETVSQLCENGKTDKLLLKTKEGKEYQARLMLNKDTKTIYAWSDVEPLENENIKCPKCNSGVKELPQTFKCENDECDFIIFKNVAGYTLTEADLESLLVDGKTDFYDFESKTGSGFTSSLIFDDEFKVVFNNELCNCPICGEGVIKSWEKCYACSNKDFTVWKNQNGATNLNFKDVLKLCSDGETRTLNFKSKDNKSYKGKLVLNDEKQIVTIV